MENAKREVVKKKWTELKAVWEPLYDGNTRATPFQAYDFLNFTGKGKPQRKDLFRLFGLKEHNFVLYADGEPIAVAPLLVKKKAGIKTAYLRGHFTTANVLDLIYSELSYDDFAFLMDEIRRALGKVRFFFDRVPDFSPVSEHLKRYFATGDMETHECFSIPVPRSYEEWSGGLKKSARHNLRTCSNRIERDGAAVSFEILRGEPVKKELCEKLMFVYADRFMIKNKLRLGPFYKIVRRILTAYLKRDKMTRWLNASKDNFHAVLRLCGEEAAFASGLVCRSGKVILNRLAIYTKYAKYSPGGLLIGSIIRGVVEINERQGAGITDIDLCQEGGGGMSYKAAYGGLPYHNYTIISKSP